MQVLNALVVDEIREETDGITSLIGLRDTLYFPQVPIILERLLLYIELEIAPEDRGRPHLLAVRVSRADGKMLKAVPIKFGVPDDYDLPTAPLDPTLFEITFDTYGLHVIDLFLSDGDTPAPEHARRVYLNVLPPDEAAGATL